MSQEEQDQEIEVLKSIYDEDDRFSFVNEGSPHGKFHAIQELPQPFNICIKKPEDNKAASKEKENAELIPVAYLPPIILDFFLPWNYPFETAPVFSLSCDWLTQQQLSKLNEHLDEIWEENKGDVILFLWFQFLQNEALQYLEITTPFELPSETNSGTDSAENENRCSKANVDSAEQSENQESAVVSPDSVPSEHHHDSGCDSNEPSQLKECVDGADKDCARVQELLKIILDFNKCKEEEEFDRSTVRCEVCFTDRLGQQCLRFSECHHAFCKDCMRNYFSVQIKEGNVKALNCLSTDCESQAHPNQVKKLVSLDEYLRYEQLLLQTTLDTMSDVVYCPRRVCQHAVIKEEGNLGRCPSCLFSFCTLCMQSYHAPSPCRIKSKDLRKLRDMYLKGTEEEKRLLEKRYGKQGIKQALEETFTAEWLEKNAKMCPYCGTHIQKTEGCNKMTCTHCRSYFCWLCDSLLSRSNPYGHYSDPNNPCDGRLFEGVIDEDPFWDEEDDDEYYDEEDEFY